MANFVYGYVYVFDVIHGIIRSALRILFHVKNEMTSSITRITDMEIHIVFN